MNVFLISRTQSKLDAVAQEIAAKHKVATKTLAVDFGNKDASIYQRISEALHDLDIGILGACPVIIQASLPSPFMAGGEKLFSCE